MLEVLVVLAFLVFFPPVRAAELVAGERAHRDGFRDVQQVPRLDGVLEVGVERPGLVRDVDVLVAFAGVLDVGKCLLQAPFLPEHVDVLRHRLLEVRAHVGVVDAVLAFEQRLDALAFLLGGSFDDRFRVAIGVLDGAAVRGGLRRARFADGDAEVLALGVRVGAGLNLRLGHVRARGVPAGARAEHEQFGERVPAEAVAAVEAHTRTLAGRVEAVDARLAVLVDLDAAHRVVLAGLDRHRFLEAVDAFEVAREVEDVL